MKTHAMKRTLVAVGLAALTIPALSFLGIRDVFPVFGFDRPDPVPALSCEAFLSREWQHALETSFSKTFFLRGLLYRTRCQTMEVLNLGCSHESEQQGIGSLAGGALLEYPYLWCYHDPTVAVSRRTTDAALRPIARLGAILASNGVDMVFVMATDKYQFLDLPAAGLAGMLFGKQRNEFQSEYGRLLSEYGIASFDTYAFLTNEAPKHATPMFPYAGLHWNAQASSLVANELLARLNRTSEKPYAINDFAGVDETVAFMPRFEDNDLGRLLNLLHNPFLEKNRSYLPVFSDNRFAPNEGAVILFGDSFSWEIAQSMEMSGEFSPECILYCNKRVPTARELDAILPELRLVVFVYQTPNMLRLGVNPVGDQAVRFCGILGRSFPQRRCAPEDGGENDRIVPLGVPIPLDALHRENTELFLSGLSGPENKGTWTVGKRALMRFRTESGAPTLEFDSDCLFYHGSQRVVVEANGTEVFNDVCSGTGLHFAFANPGAGETIDLLFRLPDAISPASIGASGDTRVLAMMLRSITVSPTADDAP